MKKVIPIILLMLVVINGLSAQEGNWGDIYNFEYTSINDSTMMKSMFGSRSIYNDDGDAIFHSMFIRKENDSIQDIISGRVVSYNYTKEDISLIDNDSSITMYDIKFAWICNLSNGNTDTARVRQLFINSIETGYSIKVERVDFQNGLSFMSWGGREPYPFTKQETTLSLPVLFRVKRIATSADIKDDLENPDRIVTYAEWTNKGFYRYSLTGEKDSLMFRGPIVRERVVDEFEFVKFDNHNGEPFVFTNFYYHQEPFYYVSTMDMYPFPYKGEGLKGYDDGGKTFIWEKMNLNLEFTKIMLKLKFIGEKMMSSSDYDLLQKKFNLLLKFANDSDLRTKK